MLSGSGSRCGSRSSLKRCYCRRHGREEPELSIQPSWSSQAARLGRAAHGTAGSRGGVESSLGDRDTGASSQLGLWDLLGLMGGRAWEGLRSRESSCHVPVWDHPWTPWEGRLSLSPSGNLSLCYCCTDTPVSFLLKLHRCRILPVKGIQVHLHPSRLISSFFPSLGWRSLGKHSSIYSASSGSCFCWRLPLPPLYPVEKTHDPLRSPLGCTKDTPVLVCIQVLFACWTSSFLTSLVSWELLFTS